nr:MAG TPA: hypothetical protein [Caudoviricetes sp.]
MYLFHPIQIHIDFPCLFSFLRDKKLHKKSTYTVLVCYNCHKNSM